VNALAGTATSIRLALRRDRVLLPVWIALLAAFTVLSGASVMSLYADAAARTATAAALNATPSLLALYGPVYDAGSAGALAVWKPAGTGAILVAVLMIVVVVRHTRLEEEDGRAELVGSTASSRLAPLAAALAVAFAATVALGVAAAAGLAITGLPLVGSLAFGAAWAGVGAVFAAVAAVTAQLTRSARIARGAALAVLALAFVLRAVGDASGTDWLTRSSPLGWVQLLRPYAGDRWWMLLPPLVLTAVLVVVAVGLRRRRDLGAGVWQERPGPAVAPAWLSGPLGLAWRLQRGVLAGWALGFALFGALLGSVATRVDGLLAAPQAQDVVRSLAGRQELTDAFFAVDMSVLGVLAAAYVVQAVSRMHTEETAGLTEPVLAGPVGRVRWAVGHLAVAVAGAVVLMGVAGLACGLAAGAATGDPGGQVVRLLGAAAVQLPAVLVVGAIAAALYGAAPRLTGLAWVVYAGFLVLAELGPFLRTPQWVIDLSPFTHVPRLPAADVTAAPLVWTTVSAVLIAILGVAAFRRRDLV
jgi:ABC-2 type transport system permease protein